MSLRIVGAGFGRTGTLSLKLALEQLGIGACYHMMEIPKQPEHAALWLAASRGERVAWDEIFAGYSAAVDWPSCVLWRELLRAYPDARVILTVRDAASWYASFRETILPRLENLPPVASPAMHALYDLGREVILRRTFGGRAGDASHAIASVRGAQRASHCGSRPRAAARLRRRGRMGASVRVPRRARPRRPVPAHEFARELRHGLAPRQRARRGKSRLRGGSRELDRLGSRVRGARQPALHVDLGTAAAHGRDADERVTRASTAPGAPGSARALRSAAARCGTRSDRARPRDRSRAPSNMLL